MKGKISNNISKLKEFFLTPAYFQSKLQLLFILMEQIQYLAILNGINFVQVWPLLQQDILIVIGLFTLCLMRIFPKISITSAISLIMIQKIALSQVLFQIVNTLLMATLIIAGIIDSISFGVRSDNAQSQSKNYGKLLHSIIVITNSILINICKPYAILHILSLLFFLILFIIKARSLILNQAYRELQMRFYMIAIFEHLRLFVANFTSADSILFFILMLIISQIVYSTYNTFAPVKHFQQLQGKESYLQLSFLILKYNQSGQFEEDIEQQINRLRNHHNDVSHRSSINQYFPLYMLPMLSKDASFLAQILSIELCIINQQLVQAFTLLHKLKGQVLWYEFINKIVLFKTEYFLCKRYQEKSKLIQLQYEQEWQQYTHFQQLLSKSAYQNLKLCYYLKQSIIELDIVKKISKKIIGYQQQIHRTYQLIKKSFIASTQRYFQYLVNVKNDYQTAEQILNNYLFVENTLIDFDLNEKLYIKIKIQDSGLLIKKVGFNTKQLLHYNRKDLEGQKLERVIPFCFRSQHQKMSVTLIHKKWEQMNVLQKKTIILNNRQTYNQCNVALRLVFDSDEGFCFQGYIHVINNQKYNLQYFLFINQQCKILDANQKILSQVDIIGQKVDNFFVNNGIGLPILKKKYQQSVRYDPLICFNNGPQIIYFYAQKSQKIGQKSRKKISTKQLDQIHQIQAKKRQTKINFSQLQKLFAQIRNDQLFFLPYLILLFLLMLFFSQNLIIYSSQLKYNHQNMVVTNGEALMQYYNNIFILAIDLTYLDLRDHYNYSQPFQQIDLISASLNLSQFNQELKQYNQGKYVIPSYNTISYSESNYEIVQMLVTNSYIYSQFNDDVFLKNVAFDGFRSIISILLMSSFTDYRISIFSLVSGYVVADDNYARIALITNIINIAIIVAIIIKLYYKMRKVEELALTYRCQAIASQKICSIQSFLRQITYQEIQLDKIYPKNSFLDKNPNTKQQNQSYLGQNVKTQTSFIRQITKRNLMSDSLNKTNLQSFVQQSGPNHILQGYSKISFKSTQSYSKIIIMLMILVGVFLGLLISNEIINNNLRDVNETASINSIVTLYRASAFYSRAIIVTLNTILLKQARNINNSKEYYKQISSYYTYLSQFVIPIFPQTKLPEFSSYKEGYNNLYQLSICQYMTCQPQLYNEFNLNFITVINKFSANLSKLVDSTINLNANEFNELIKSPQIQSYIRSLFSSQKLLREFTIDLSMIYLDNYQIFMTNLLSSKMKFITAILVITTFGLLLFIYLIKYIRDEQQLFIKIIKIYY